MHLSAKLLPFSGYFFKKYPIKLTLFFLAPLLLILEVVAIPYALKIVVDAFAEYSTNRSYIFDAVAPALWLAAGAWAGLLILIRLQEWWQVYVLPKVEADIRMSVTEYLLGHSFQYFSNQLSGNLANKIADIPRALDSLYMNLRWNIVAPVGTIIAAVVMTYFISPLMAGVVTCWVCIEISISLFLVRFINNAGKENAEDKSQLSGTIVDSITNIMAVKLFAKRSHELHHILSAQVKEQKSNALLKLRICIYRFLIDCPVTVMWGVLGYLLITYWQQGHVTTGEVVFLFNVVWSVMMRLWFMGESMAEIFKEISVARQALHVIMQPHTLVDAAEASQLQVIQGEIAFKDVTFHYNKGSNIFENKNVTIAAGSKVGLVGFSGSGKSTFCHLILRFYDVESGKITIDSQDIAKVTQDSLRENIAMIPQDTALFHRSLMENIRYGRIDASDEEVIEAAKKAHCHTFISALPEGYATLVGERGLKLSGGQRQRIAIARAILKDAPILLLDEATSALDSVTEQEIQESLYGLMEDRTTLVIAHRLSTLSAMDRILVFDNGRIIEDGSHEQLIERNGHYAHMWQMQAGGFLPEKEEV